MSQLGRLDTVVNNAGVMLLGPAVGAPLQEWERMVDINVKGRNPDALHERLPPPYRRAPGPPSDHRAAFAKLTGSSWRRQDLGGDAWRTCAWRQPLAGF